MTLADHDDSDLYNPEVTVSLGLLGATIQYFLGEGLGFWIHGGNCSDQKIKLDQIRLPSKGFPMVEHFINIAQSNFCIKNWIERSYYKTDRMRGDSEKVQFWSQKQAQKEGINETSNFFTSGKKTLRSWKLHFKRYVPKVQLNRCLSNDIFNIFKKPYFKTFKFFAIAF